MFTKSTSATPATVQQSSSTRVPQQPMPFMAQITTPRQPPLPNSNFAATNQQVHLSRRSNYQQQQQLVAQPSLSSSSSSTANVGGALDMPDLSHLSESERKIIEAVLERQKAEEAKDMCLVRSNPILPMRSSTNHNINGNFSNKTNTSNNLSGGAGNLSDKSQPQRHSISDIAQETKQRYGSIDTGNVCDICRKTKFANGGVGHSCFNCKARCCLRCSFKYTAKTKQLWACLECKRKQDELLKSGQWLNNPAIAKKNYTSDYILNKAAAVGLGIPSANDSLDRQISEPKQPARPGGKRVLPSIVNKGLESGEMNNYSLQGSMEDTKRAGLTRQTSVSQSNKQPPSVPKYNTYVASSNSTQSVPELTRDDQSFTQQPRAQMGTVEDNEENELSANLPNSVDTNAVLQSSVSAVTTSGHQSGGVKREPSLRQKQLIKQVSLNNPPGYVKQREHFRHSETIHDEGDDGESSLFENSSSAYMQIKFKSFTSNQELTQDPYFSSPSSSISQLNNNGAPTRNRTSRGERILDPLLMLKTLRASNSGLNSNSSLADNASSALKSTTTSKDPRYDNDDESSLYSSTNRVAPAVSASLPEPLARSQSRTLPRQNLVHHSSIAVDSKHGQLPSAGELDANEFEKDPSNRPTLPISPPLDHSSPKKAINRILPIPKQQQQQQQRNSRLNHADSLSSDPSESLANATNQANGLTDSVNQQQYDLQSKTDKEKLEESNIAIMMDEQHEHIRRHSSKTKRNSKPRKQPVIPTSSGGVNVNSAIPPHASLSNGSTGPGRFNFKQHSLTSSDENLNDEYGKGARALNGKRYSSQLTRQIGANHHHKLDEHENENDYDQNDYLGDEEENENMFNDEDIDEEIRSTTEYTTDDMDVESGSVNFKPTPMTQPALKTQSKTIDDYLIQNPKKEEILAAKMTKFLSPTTWQVSADGKKMIGHLVLKRTNCNCSTTAVMHNSSSNSTIDSSCDFNSSQSLGLKIVGGRPNLVTNQTSAYVVKVKKDSISDTVGRLQAGDEVVKWNGKCLRGLTYDEVFSLMNKSKHDNEVELDVERIIATTEAEAHQQQTAAESNLNDTRSSTNDVSSTFSSPRSQDSLMATPMRTNLDNSLVLMTDLSKTYMSFYEDYDVNNNAPYSGGSGVDAKIGPMNQTESEKLSDDEESNPDDTDEPAISQRPMNQSQENLLVKSKFVEKSIHNNLSFDSDEDGDVLEDMDKIGENEPDPVDIRTFLQSGYKWRVAVKALSFVRFLQAKSVKFDLPEYLVCKQIANDTIARLDVSQSLTPLKYIDEESLSQQENQHNSYIILNEIKHPLADQFDQSAFTSFLTPSVKKSNNNITKEENQPDITLSSVFFSANETQTPGELERARHACDFSINGDISLPKISPLSFKGSNRSIVRSGKAPSRRQSRIALDSISPYSLNKAFYRRSADSELLELSAKSNRLSRILNGTQNNLYSIDLKTPASPLSYRLKHASISSNALQSQILDTQFTPLLFSSFNQQQQQASFKPNNLAHLIAVNCSPPSATLDRWSIKSSGSSAARTKRRRKTQEVNKATSDTILHKGTLTDADRSFNKSQHGNNTGLPLSNEATSSPNCIEHLVFTLRNFAVTACFFVSPKPNSSR